MAEGRVHRRLAAILAADVAGYSRLMAIDEEATLAALSAHLEGHIRPCIAAHGGRVVKTTGDGVLAEFTSVVDAVRCALAWQAGMDERGAGTADRDRFRFRIGINLGDVIVQEDDVYGDGVNVAARLEALAEPGGVCVSGTVYDHLHGKLDIGLIDLGEQHVKNMARPIRAYRVTAQADRSLLPPRRSARKHRALLIAAGVAASVIAAAFLAWPASWPGIGSLLPGGSASAVSAGKPSIAVLPFSNLSSDETQEYFSDGISEDLIISLSKNSGLLVIARNSSFAYRGKSPDVREIARDLKVRYVLSGSVRREKDRIRVNAELIDSNSSSHVWADRFDRDVEDVFQVQDEITERIISMLVAEVTRAEIDRARRKPPATFAAYDNYLRGLDLFRARFARPPWGKTLSESREFLERAIAQDPGFGLAWSVLAENYVSAWVQLPHYEPLQHEHQNPETLERALAAAKKAIEVDPGLAEGYAKMGWVLHWMRRPQEAQAAYLRAFEINPNLTDDAYPNALVKFGRHDEAIDYLARQIRLDPSFGRNYGNLGLAYYLRRDYSKAIENLKTCKQLAGRWPACNIWMAAALAQSGRKEDAIAEAKIVTARNPDFSVTRWVAFEPYSRREDSDHLADGLRKAGFPD